MWLYFKLKHDIQNNSELPLAREELIGLLNGRVKEIDVREIKNFVDVLAKPPLAYFLDRDGWRIQDVMTRMVYQGEIQGFFTRTPAIDVSGLVKRLSYFRDFFVLLDGIKESDLINRIYRIYPSLNSLARLEFTDTVQRYKVTPFIQIYTVRLDDEDEGKEEGYDRGGGLLSLIRFIPLHTLYEASDFICRLSEKEAHVNRMFDESITHLNDNFYTPYLAESVMLGKGISDFIDDRRAPQQYLTHYYFGIRAKFFPRMIRAILNIIGARSSGSGHVGAGAGADANANANTDADLILDPMTGCGTLNVEASLCGINSIGMDINPLFVLISRVKIESMHYPVSALREVMENHLTRIRNAISHLEPVEPAELNIPQALSRNIGKENMRVVGIIKRCIDESDDRFRDFLKLPLAYYARSMLRNYTAEKTYERYSELLRKMFFALVYLHKFMKDVYELSLGDARVFVGDVTTLGESREFREALRYFNRNDVDVIITSPPYGSAIDYVLDHAHALHILFDDADYIEVDRKTIGSPRYSDGDKTEHGLSIDDLPELVQNELAKVGATKKKHTYLRYFTYMKMAFDEMHKVLKDDGYLVLIIGKEQPMEAGKKKESSMMLGKAMESLGSQRFQIVSTMDLELQKASVLGNIPTEHIIFFKK